MGYFDNMTDKMMNDQESKKDALGLDASISSKKEHLHVTLPHGTLEKLKSEAEKRHLSLSVMVQILIDEHL